MNMCMHKCIMIDIHDCPNLFTRKETMDLHNRMMDNVIGRSYHKIMEIHDSLKSWLSRIEISNWIISSTELWIYVM